MKYPVRLALNPFISTIGWLLPNLISGSIIVAVVLSLPTAGPLLLQALMAQDMYLAGAFILLICALTLSARWSATSCWRWSIRASGSNRSRSDGRHRRRPTVRRIALAVASQWQLMWWAFRRHRLAMVGLVVTILLYIDRAGSRASSPSTTRTQQNARAAYHPPQAIASDRYRCGRQLDASARYFQPDAADARPGDAGRDLQGGHDAQGRPPVLRRAATNIRCSACSAPTSICSPRPIQRQPLLPVRRRPARPRHLQPHHAGRADLAVDRPRRRVPVAAASASCSAASRATTAAASTSSIQRVIEFMLSLPTIPIWLALAAAAAAGLAGDAATIS